MRKSLLGALLFLPALASASFEATPFSVKAEGLGGAFVAMADDATSVFLNPAGLSTLGSPEAALMYGKPLYGVEGLDLSQGYTAIGLPIGRRFGFGAGASAFRASGLLSEYQATAGFSGRFSRFAAGVSATYLYHAYDIAKDPAYSGQGVFANGHSKGAIGLNVGFMGFVAPRLQLGMAGRNLNSPDVGLSSEDRVPREISIGALYKFQKVNAIAEIGQREETVLGRSANVWKLGAEIPISLLSVRCGLNSDSMAAGLGLRMGALQVDYAFTFYNHVEAANLGGQMLALSYRMGGGGKSQSARLEERRDNSSQFGILIP